MKPFGKILLLLLVLILPNAASALVLTGSEVITDYGTDFYGYSGYNYVSSITFGTGIEIPVPEIGQWGHTLSSDYMPVPEDWQVLRAVLQIEGSTPYGVGDQIVTLEESYRWTRPTGWECLTSYSDQVFEMTLIDPSLWNESPLLVTLDHPAAVPVTIYTATLLIEYGPGTGTAIPEPATLLLFGAGLAGFGILRRRQR